jgi:hypothetical protein
MTMDVRTPRQQFERRLTALKNERDGGGWLSHWRDLSDYILPRRGQWLTTDRNKGDRRNGKIIDNTATLAARTLASGMMAGITSPARPWFRLTTPDPELMKFGPVKLWMDDVETRMREVFARSNLYNALPVMYEELGVFGSAAIMVQDDFEDIIRVHPYTVGEYYLANSARLNVDSLYREFSLTVAQAVDQFVRQPGRGMDWSRVSNTVKALYDRGSYDEWVEYCHAIEPNPDRLPGMQDAKNMPFRSVYWEKGAEREQLARVGGFKQFPIMAPRWHLMGQDVYGRSPGMDCLGDVRALQTMQKEKAKAIQKMVAPPLVGGASAKGAAISALPGGVTFVDAAEPVKQLAPLYQVNPQIQHLVADIQDHRERINRAFFADLFLMISQLERGQITAYEVQVRQEEKLLMLGPVLERVHDELLEPLVDRTFAIMGEKQLLPPPPPELQGVELGVEMISMLAQSQKAIETGAIERFAGFIGNQAAVNPEILDVYDMDAAARRYGGALGVAAEIIRPDDAVSSMRAERAKQAQAAQAMEMAATAAQGAETLSKTDVRGNNALTAMLGIGGV